MLEPFTLIPRGIESRRQHEPVRIDPARPTMLEAEIKAVLVSRPNPDEAARRILRIPRIKAALLQLDAIDNPRHVFESTDAR